MRTATVMLILGALFALFVTLVPPLQSAVPQPGHASCCMKTKESPNDCGRQTPGSKQDQQCCANCVFALDFWLGDAVALPAPHVGNESFASFTANARSRSDRPPVPPPRSRAV